MGSNARKPTNMLKMSKKPSLKRSAVLAEAERIVKERNNTRKTAGKPALKAPAKTTKKAAAKKTPAKKTAAKKTGKTGKKDPMWKNLAKALKEQKK